MARVREILLPWDSQPQEAVQFRADLATELGFYSGFINPLTAWNNGVGYSPSGLEPKPTQAGFALSNTTGTAVGTYPFSGSPESSELTVIMHAVRFGAQPDSGFGTALYAPKLSGSQDPFDWFIKDSGERVRLNTTTTDGSGQIWETTENWPVGTWQTAAFTWRSGSHPDLFRNGVKLSRSLTAPGVPSGVLKPSGPLSINLGALRLNGAVAAGLVFSKAWSDDQIAEYAKDFQSLLQLVEPQTIWVPVSAGGGTPTLTVPDSTHAHTLDNVVLTSSTALVMQDMAHGHALDAPTLSTGTALTVADAQHAHALDAVALTSQTDLAAADMAHGHALDNVVLTLGGASLTAADLLHGHAMDGAALTLDTFLAAFDLLHGHALDGDLNLGPPAIETQDNSGGWPIYRRKKKKDDDEELEPAVIEAVAVVPVARRKIALEKLIGKKAAAQVNEAQLSSAIRMLKRKRQDEELMLM